MQAMINMDRPQPGQLRMAMARQQMQQNMGINATTVGNAYRTSRRPFYQLINDGLGLESHPDISPRTCRS